MNIGYKVQDKECSINIEVYKKHFTDNIVGELISERKRLGLTQQDIADISGMKAPNVTRIESRKYSPSLNVLMRYARAIGKEIRFELVDVQK